MKLSGCSGDHAPTGKLMTNIHWLYATRIGLPNPFRLKGFSPVIGAQSGYTQYIWKGKSEGAGFMPDTKIYV